MLLIQGDSGLGVLAFPRLALVDENEQGGMFMAVNEELLQFQKSAEHVIGLGLRSKAATIRRLSPDIVRYLELGYSLAQLLEVLRLAGLAPTPLSTLKSVLARLRASESRR